MNSRIVPDGHLEILRCGKWQPQICPWTRNEDLTFQRECGDWCPLFHEADDGKHIVLACSNGLYPPLTIVEDYRRGGTT